MDLTSPRTIKSLLAKQNIHPKKHWGQNFLVSQKVLETFINSADVERNDIIIEVGAGIGTITVELAKRAKKVIAVEKDHRLIPILRETLGELQNVEIVEEDIRTFDPKTYNLKIKNYGLVGNLPFYLTNYLIRKFLESPIPPKEMVVMIQKEVAERIVAKPPKMNLLAVSVQFYATPTIITFVSKKSFWPEPEVNAAIVTITPVRKEWGVRNDTFFRIVRAGFAHPRKYLTGNLQESFNISREALTTIFRGIDVHLQARAENLALKDWIHLAEAISHSPHLPHT